MRYLIFAEVTAWLLCGFFVHIVLGQYGIGPTAAAEYFGQVVETLSNL